MVRILLLVTLRESIMPIDWEDIDDSEIKRMAWEFYDSDDLFTPIENLHEKLSSCSSQEVQFASNYEIFLALLMMADGVLPSQAYKALAKIFIDAVSEIGEKKYTVDALKMAPPPRGRKSMDDRDKLIVYSVGRLKLSGVPAMEAYKQIAGEHHVAEDTVRRIYERFNKELLMSGRKKLP